MLEKTKKIQEELVQIRRDLHQIPEIGLDLPQTSQYVFDKLLEYGYEPERIIDSGIVATVGKEGGKVLLLRADMDALPIVEDTGLEFASTNGNMHACGHDNHTTMLLGAAKLLKEHEDELEGMVKLMFQPAEEVFLGAKAMLEAGVMENPKVDAAFGMHDSTDFPVGQFAYGYGTTMASSDNFEIIIYGKGAHGATPYQGKDPINVAVKIHEALQSVIARQIDAQKLAVLTIGQIEAGKAGNVIPDKALMRGTMRAYDQESRDIMYTSMRRIVEDIAHAFECTVEVNDLANVPAFVNDDYMMNLYLETLEELGYSKDLIHERKSLGSEDFACIAQLVPTAFGTIGLAPAKEEDRQPLHRPTTVFDEDGLHIGTAIFLSFTKKWFAENK